jgi:hypothetical protein
VTVNNSIEIRAPEKSWKLRKQPINSIVVYKDWMYCAGNSVQGSSFKVLLHEEYLICLYNFIYIGTIALFNMRK